jgi:tyrosinase
MATFTANRRGVLLGLIGGVASIGALIFKAPHLTAADTIRVRPDASTTEGKEMLKVYAKAVEAMKQKPAHEPTSWWFQANLHWLPPRGGGANDPIWGTQQPAALDKIFAAPANADQATRDRLAKLRKLALDSLQGATSPFGPNRAWATCPHHEPAFLV